MKKRRLLLAALAVPALTAPRVHAKDAREAMDMDTPQDDPVLKARATRAAARGVDERDLPPLPKSLVEPPPLPPSETHPKDLPGYRAKHRRGHHGKSRKGRAGSGSHPRRATRHK